jgi:hypothetical protein
VKYLPLNKAYYLFLEKLRVLEKNFFRGNRKVIIESYFRGGKMNLKNRIKIICAEKEIQLSTIADHLEISYSKFSKMVNGKQVITVKEGLIITRFLDKPFEEVFYLEE